MQHPVSRWLAVAILGLYLSGISVLAATLSGQPNLQGHWVVQEEMCTLLCGFTLINDDSDRYDRMRLQFEPGTWSRKASGPFVHIKGSHYELSGGGAKIPFELYRGSLISNSGSVYKRVSLRID